MRTRQHRRMPKRRPRAVGRSLMPIRKPGHGQRLGSESVQGASMGDHAQAAVVWSRLAASLGVRAKLTVGAANDRHEREAERTADAVMRMPDDASNRKADPRATVSSDGVATQTPPGSDSPIASASGLPELDLVQRVAARSENSAPASSETQGLTGQGQPLPDSVRDYFEPRFGHDFSQVRVHTGVAAQDSAQRLNAQAFTLGHDIAFAPGRFSPQTWEGKHILAHELTHVLQQSGSMSGIQPRIQRRNCTSDDDPDSIVEKHTVDPKKIDEPGDSVRFSVRFKCNVRGFRSELEDSAGHSLNMATYPPQSSFPRSEYERTWDGKRGYSNVGTYMVDDGQYRHRLDEVKYAYQYNPDTRTSSDLYAIGDDLSSPEVEVATRRGAFSDYSSNHFSQANLDLVAKIIKSELGIGNEAEQRAIGWAVRNQMVRLNTRSAADARDHFNDADNQPADAKSRHNAQYVLSLDMGHDTTDGAIKWFSPMSMPSQGESCANHDCGGGTISVADNSGTVHQKYAPTFHQHMTYVTVTGVREWHARFYKL